MNMYKSNVKKYLLNLHKYSRIVMKFEYLMDTYTLGSKVVIAGYSHLNCGNTVIMAAYAIYL